MSAPGWRWRGAREWPRQCWELIDIAAYYLLADPVLVEVFRGETNTIHYDYLSLIDVKINVFGRNREQLYLRF